MPSVKKKSWRRRLFGSNVNFHLRVQNLVRRLRPERVRTQLRCLISSVADSKLLPRNLSQQVSPGHSEEQPPDPCKVACVEIRVEHCEEEPRRDDNDEPLRVDNDRPVPAVDVVQVESVDRACGEAPTSLEAPTNSKNTGSADSGGDQPMSEECTASSEGERDRDSSSNPWSRRGESEREGEEESRRSPGRPKELLLAGVTLAPGDTNTNTDNTSPSLSLSLPTLVVDGEADDVDCCGGNPNSLLCTPSPCPSPRNKSPVTVQEWVDSLPLTPVEEEATTPREAEAIRVEAEVDEGQERATVAPANDNDDSLTLGAEAGHLCVSGGSVGGGGGGGGGTAGGSTSLSSFPAVQVTGCREPSEAGSHCSSVESLLEARRADPEEVLLGLGFGGPSWTADTGRIPARFLQPSRLKGVAIDDFLRHQQDLVQNFETGFCGYRGLTGPSHAMPSVIVAKIMEKLREHERGSSVASPPRHTHSHRSHNNLITTDPSRSGRRPSHADAANTVRGRNRFSKVARNVLTKIRCVPGSGGGGSGSGGSVLTPDNRRWLDSQGDRSPEVARRRLIIGQQSFTLSRDGEGDLIESPPSSLADSDRWTSSTGTPSAAKTTAPPLENGGHFPSIEEAGSDLSPFGPAEAAAQPPTGHNGDKKNGLSNGGIPAEVKLSAASSFEENERPWTVSVGDSGLPSSGRSSRGIDDLDPRPLLEVDDLYTVPSVEVIESLDRVIESLERIIEPLEAGSCSSLSRQDQASDDHDPQLDQERTLQLYQELCSLAEQLQLLGLQVDCGTPAQFYNLKPNERCALQCRVVRTALSAYHSQLAGDDMHTELKTCLGIEVQKLADLLTTTSDCDRLATIVTQMTVLLSHQAHLGRRLRELATGDRPLPCHELCEAVMRRVRGLELLVQRNARQLAEMRRRATHH